MKQITTLRIIAFLLITSNAIFAQSFLAKDTQTIALQGNAVFPEGVLTLPNNDLLVGGFGDGSIQRINAKNEVTYFSKPGENGMVIAVGMHLDEQHHRLWVANFNFATASGKPGSNFKVFDSQTGKLLKTIPEHFIEGAFFNEVTQDDQGTVYVSNTFGPNIYSTHFDSSNASVFITNDLLKNPSPDQPFGLNGLTITPDHRFLIASVMNRTIKGGGRLVRIDLSNKKATSIALQADEATASFSGSDGMFFYKGQLLMVNVFSSAGAILSARFNADYSSAQLKIHPQFQSLYDRPTASAIRNGKLYTVNSQLNHIIDDKDGQLNTPPVTPFSIVGVSLKKLFN